MGRRSLRNLVVWFWFYCMDKIRKFHCILNCKHRNIVSHQIRSPLTNLKWIVEILTSGVLGKPESKQTEYFKILKENLERMQKLVSELLTVSRIESAKIVLKKENFSRFY